LARRRRLYDEVVITKLPKGQPTHGGGTLGKQS
jgi:hypothetical protein